MNKAVYKPSYIAVIIIVTKIHILDFIHSFKIECEIVRFSLYGDLFKIALHFPMRMEHCGEFQLKFTEIGHEALIRSSSSCAV